MKIVFKFPLKRVFEFKSQMKFLSSSKRGLSKNLAGLFGKAFAKKIKEIKMTITMTNKELLKLINDYFGVDSIEQVAINVKLDDKYTTDNIYFESDDWFVGHFIKEKLSKGDKNDNS